MGADAYLEKNTDIKDVGICGGEKYRRDEKRYLAHKDGGKRRHLTRKETLFPKDMLEQMCNKCGKWVDDYAMKDKDIEMLCDACPGWADGHEYCDKFRRARTSAPTSNQRRRQLDATDDELTSVPLDALEACDSDTSKLAEAEESCKIVNQTDTYSGCVYDVCVVLSEKEKDVDNATAKDEDILTLVNDADESEKEVETILAEREAEVIEGSSSSNLPALHGAFVSLLCVCWLGTINVKTSSNTSTRF